MKAALGVLLAALAIAPANAGEVATLEGAVFHLGGQDDNQLDPHDVYRVTQPQVNTCYFAGALRAISLPDARNQLGDVQYTRTIIDGRCTTLGNALPIVVLSQRGEFSQVRQWNAELFNFSRPTIVWNRDLVGYDGKPPHGFPSGLEHRF